MTIPALPSSLICILDSATPQDWYGCIINANSATPIIILYSVMLLMVIGWSISLKPSAGTAVGGFFSAILGVLFMLAGWITIELIMIPMIVMFFGIFMLIGERSST